MAGASGRAPLRAAMVGSSLLSVAGLAISVWWFPWYYAPRLSTPCDISGLRPGVASLCPKITYLVPWTVFGRPIASFGIGFFLVMLVLSMPPLWRSPLRSIHVARLVVALIGVVVACSVISVEPNDAFTHYAGLPLTISIVLLLFVVTATTLPRAMEGASEGLGSRTVGAMAEG